MTDLKGAGVDGLPALDLLMRDLGYSCTSSIATMRATLEHAGISHSGPGILSEVVVTRALILMCRGHAAISDGNLTPEMASMVYKGIDLESIKRLQSWDVEVFYNACLEKVLSSRYFPYIMAIMLLCLVGHVEN
jgi:hypothetical protein